jgi:DNA end-binding protein Ku
MAAAYKTVISFGLVAIPIAMHTAVQDNDISFNQLHKEDSERVRYKKICGHCGKEVKAEDIIKGFQYDKDKYVTITDDEIEKIKTEKEKSIQILHFASLSQISPVYYDKSYYILPEAGGEKAYELLRRALMEEQKIAVGKTVMGTHEALMAIIPREDGLVIQTMFFEDEIKDIPKSYKKHEPSEQELSMAKMLISSMDTPFDPSVYQDEYQVRLKQLLADKIAGVELKRPHEQKNVTVIDLMEALKKSVENANEKTKPKRIHKKSTQAG